MQCTRHSRIWIQPQVIQWFSVSNQSFLILSFVRLWSFNIFSSNHIIFRKTNLAVNYVTYEMLISETLVGGLIGIGGFNISRIRNESGATIKVRKPSGFISLWMFLKFFLNLYPYIILYRFVVEEVNKITGKYNLVEVLNRHDFFSYLRFHELALIRMMGRRVILCC